MSDLEASPHVCSLHVFDGSQKCRCFLRCDHFCCPKFDVPAYRHEEGYFVNKHDVAGNSHIAVTTHNLDGYADMLGLYMCGCAAGSLPF